MIEKLMFHERCNSDIEKIVAQFKSSNLETSKAFQLHLLDIYQLIYENPNAGTDYQMDKSDPFSRTTFKYLELHRFSCIIFYKLSPHRVVTVLGIFMEKRNWHR